MGRTTGTVLLCLVLLVIPRYAAAEPLLDLFAGAAFTSSNDVKLSVPGFSETVESDFKKSFVVGARGGYWFGFFGVNLDISYFRPEFDPDDVTSGGVTVKTDLDVVAVGVNAMLRGQLVKTSEVPQGRLQPYLFAGPTVFVSRLDFDVSGVGSDTSVTANVGFTAGTGVTFMIVRNVGLFGEYRFTYNRPHFDISGVKIEPKLDTHHLIAGVTFRF